MFYFNVVSNVFHYKTGLFLFTILSTKFSLTRRTYFIELKNARQEKTPKITSYPFFIYIFLYMFFIIYRIAILVESQYLKIAIYSISNRHPSIVVVWNQEKSMSSQPYCCCCCYLHVPLFVCRKANIVVSFLVDVALGMLLIWWLYRDNHITMLADTLVPAADVSVCTEVRLHKMPKHIIFFRVI